MRSRLIRLRQRKIALDLTSGDQRQCDVRRGLHRLCQHLDLHRVTSGVSQNCSAVLYAVATSDSKSLYERKIVMESLFWNLGLTSCSDGDALVDVTCCTRSCGSNGFVVSDTTPFYPVCKALSCPSSALLDDDTVEGLDCSS